MRIVHIADTHLGYRAYHRINAQGTNVREADVARAFREAVDRISDLAPDLVVVAGDLFHVVRPSNAAIADAFRQFARLRRALPETPAVVIAGNHDTPRSAETGNILRLYEEIPGVHVAYHEARRLRFPHLDAAVLCVPHNALAASSERMDLEPDPQAAINVLVAHAALDDPRVRFFDEYGGARLPREAWRPEDWTYVALGHYHRYTKLAPNAAYCGATERTTPDLWQEAAIPKGFVEFDTERGALTFHELESPRRVLDLGPLDARGLAPAEVDAALEAVLAAVDGEIEGKIVRVRVLNCPRSVYRALDHRKIRELRARALHFHLDVRPPEIIRTEAAGAPGRAATLAEELQRFLRSRWELTSPDLDRDALTALALQYLQEVEAIPGG
ncbi:MAG: metallophosphoesterase [Gemmatimonadetes bacterium]|nr:metallophosphoesterase [Gemmatimonadota bacterium]